MDLIGPQCSGGLSISYVDDVMIMHPCLVPGLQVVCRKCQCNAHVPHESNLFAKIVYFSYLRCSSSSSFRIGLVPMSFLGLAWSCNRIDYDPHQGSLTPSILSHRGDLISAPFFFVPRRNLISASSV